MLFGLQSPVTGYHDTKQSLHVKTEIKLDLVRLDSHPSIVGQSKTNNNNSIFNGHQMSPLTLGGIGEREERLAGPVNCADICLRRAWNTLRRLPRPGTYWTASYLITSHLPVKAL